MNTIIPTLQRIPANANTQRLYALESRAHGAFTTAAKELARVRGDAESDYWTVTLPQAIFDFLDSTSHTAAVAACKGFLAAFDKNEVKP